MTQFFHDLGYFAMGWVWGWVWIKLYPLLLQAWQELKIARKEWRGKSH